MLLITVLAVIVNLIILWQVVVFFRGAGACRESDKHTVAAIGSLSLLFLLANLLTAARPAALHALTNIPLLVAHNLAVAIIMLGLVKTVVARRTCERDNL